MNTSPDVNPGTADRRPWWKRLWDNLVHTSVPPAPAAPVKIKVASKPAKKIQVAVPVKVESVSPSSPDPAARRSGSWQIYSTKEGADTSPIQVVHDNRRVFGIIYQSKDGWLFWTGPKSKVFTTAGRGDIWTTPDPKIAVIVANFIYGYRLPEMLQLTKKEKPNRR